MTYIKNFCAKIGTCILASPMTFLRRRRNRKRLTNKDITIFCSNCTGGIISHELGLPFLSPTVNLLISSKDFIRFLLNIENYLSKELVFIEPEGMIPVAMLGDIKIHFTHYKSEEIASEKWSSRVKRINWSNTYIILNDRDGVTYEDLVSLKKVKCKNMLVFSSHDYADLPYVFYMPQFEGQKEVGYTLGHLPITNEYYFEKYFDYVGWLNSENIPCEKFRK